MARKKKPPLSAVVAFMSDETQAQIETQEREAREFSLLPLDVILPDLDQPRRLLPGDLVESLGQGRLSRFEVIQAWLKRAEAEPAGVGSGRNVHELKRLADSIERHGLISPISVRAPRPDEPLPAGVKYLIVTGERRYWAQVYLAGQGKQIQEGETIADPAQIKATIAPPGVTVRAHQLIENLLREDINAVEKARGMWALRYELSGVNYSSPSTEEIVLRIDLAEAESDAEEAGLDRVNDSSPSINRSEAALNIDRPNAAAGVNDSSPSPDGPPQPGVNYGKDRKDSSPQLVPWARVEETLGISKRYRIFVISVLKLSPEAQALVAAHNLAEMTIRPIVQKLKDRPELQMKALQQLLAWQAENEADEGPARPIVASVKALVEQLLAEKPGQAQTSPAQASRTVSSAPVIRFRGKVRQTLDFLNRLKSSDREGLTQALSHQEFADVMLDLRNLRQQIDAILEAATQAGSVAEQMSPLEEGENRN